MPSCPMIVYRAEGGTYSYVTIDDTRLQFV
jgi:hypothetical protein